MRIEILGPGCSKCNSLEKTVKELVSELKIPADVIKISDINTMVERGILSTPALFIDGIKKSEGRTPSKDELKKWLQGGQ
jgi:small redox-active disulfide protein 2